MRLRELIRNGVHDIQWYMCLHGGGKSAPAVEQQPLKAPTPPVEEASVEIDEDKEKLDKKRTGKSSLKIPLATSPDTGLKV